MANQEENQATFTGWAIVELFGHTKEVGHVTTQYFGDKAMFQIDIPEIPAREVVIDSPEWADVDGATQLIPAGTKVERAGLPSRSRIVSPGAVYSLNPCSQEYALRQRATMVRRSYKILELAPSKSLKPGEQSEPMPAISHFENCEGSDEDVENGVCNVCGAAANVVEEEQDTESGHYAAPA